jgi:carbon starvation protein CstA
MINPETGKPSPAVLVNAICSSWLGKVGAVLAILGVVAAPITSGDTAFRSARLIAADFMHYKQNKIYKRIVLSLPIFVVSIVLMFVNFDILWRYFAWFNQSLSVFTLWAVTVWMTKRCVSESRNLYTILIPLVPALWMTMVCTTYILIAPEGFQLNHALSYTLGGLVTFGLLACYMVWTKKKFSK